MLSSDLQQLEKIIQHHGQRLQLRHSEIKNHFKWVWTYLKVFFKIGSIWMEGKFCTALSHRLTTDLDFSRLPQLMAKNWDWLRLSCQATVCWSRFIRTSAWQRKALYTNFTLQWNIRGLFSVQTKSRFRLMTTNFGLQQWDRKEKQTPGLSTRL